MIFILRHFDHFAYFLGASGVGEPRIQVPAPASFSLSPDWARGQSSFMRQFSGLQNAFCEFQMRQIEHAPVDLDDAGVR